MSLDTHVVLTVRGTPIPKDLAAARLLHDSTAGSEAGIAAARALGDLSHKVYAPLGDGAGELLFVDAWANPSGIGRFFSDGHVQEQAARMFSARDATIWVRAPGSFSWVLQSPAGRNDRFLGMVRGPVASVERAIAAFVEADRAGQREARKRGLVSHELFVKLPMPGDTGPAEVLGLDLWFDAAGMGAHYEDQAHMAPLRSAFAGPPQASVWAPAPGPFSEW